MGLAGTSIGIAIAGRAAARLGLPAAALARHTTFSDGTGVAVITGLAVAHGSEAALGADLNAAATATDSSTAHRAAADRATAARATAARATGSIGAIAGAAASIDALLEPDSEVVARRESAKRKRGASGQHQSRLSSSGYHVPPNEKASD